MNVVHFVELAILVVALLAAWNKLFMKVVIYEYEKGLFFDHGKLSKVADAGAHWIRRSNTQVTKVDMRPRLLQITGQEVMTSDGVGIKLSVAAKYEVKDARAAILNSENYLAAIYAQLQLALRETICAMTMDELMESRGNIGAKLLELSEETARQLGLQLSSAAIKDIMLTGELKKAFAQVMKARKEGQAALERARGESAALRNLANAAKMMESNPALLQLRALQAMAENGGNTLVLGMPPNMPPFPFKRPGPGAPPPPPPADIEPPVD